MTTPRAFVIRHGETEWSLNGRHTGSTELSLTSNGEKRIKATGRALIGDDRLIVPRNLAHMYFSSFSPTPTIPLALKPSYSENLVWVHANCSFGNCSYVSPRRRAQRTLELLELGCKEKLPWEEFRQHGDEGIRTNASVEITDDIREWDYGNYEGVTSHQIQAQRAKDGLEPWDIWRDGCPGGE
jgi:broad specificity phosphatase PhoE